MGLGSKALDGAPLMYVLTLGVAEAWRHRGIASALLDAVHTHAAHEWWGQPRTHACMSVHGGSISGTCCWWCLIAATLRCAGRVSAAQLPG